MKTTPSKNSVAVDDDRAETTAPDETSVPADAETADTPPGTDAAAADAAAGTEAGQGTDTQDDTDVEPDPYEEAEAAAAAGVGTAAAAVVSAGLGVVALTGAWSGRVAAERETLIGQINTSGGSAAQQIAEIYGDAWHTTALVNGLFALVALLVGVFVLVRPAFGAPSAQPQAGWVRAVATAGIALGVLGVLISVGMYFDLFVSLPGAGAATSGG